MVPNGLAAATFGGTFAYNIPTGLSVASAANGSVALSVAGNPGGGQTADLFDVSLQPGSANVFRIDPAGDVIAAGNLQNAGTLNVFSATGDLQVAPLINSINQLSRVAPFYTASGAAVASTFHGVIGSAAGVLAGGNVTVTLTNSAVFSSASSYAVFASSDNGGLNPDVNVLMRIVSATQLIC